jgi:hypothetical protein
MEGPNIAEGPNILFQGLQFDAPCSRNILEIQGREIRLPGPWAKAGEFGNIDLNGIIAPGIRVFEHFEQEALIVAGIRVIFWRHVGFGATFPLDVLKEFLLYTTPCAQTMGFIDQSPLRWSWDGSRAIEARIACLVFCGLLF